VEPKHKKDKTSESSEASVKLRHGKFACPHRTRATKGSTAIAALLPGHLALVRVRQERQRSITGAIDDRYGRVAHRNVVIRNRGRATDVRLVRFGRGKVRDECRHPTSWVRRSGLSLSLSMRLGGLRESMGVQRGTVRGSPRRR
jgi:hypothetical protein